MLLMLTQSDFSTRLEDAGSCQMSLHSPRYVPIITKPFCMPFLKDISSSLDNNISSASTWADTSLIFIIFSY